VPQAANIVNTVVVRSARPAGAFSSEMNGLNITANGQNCFWIKVVEDGAKKAWQGGDAFVGQSVMQLCLSYSYGDGRE
jgi:hypothetical protein